MEFLCRGFSPKDSNWLQISGGRRYDGTAAKGVNEDDDAAYRKYRWPSDRRWESLPKGYHKLSHAYIGVESDEIQRVVWESRGTAQLQKQLISQASVSRLPATGSVWESYVYGLFPDAGSAAGREYPTILLEDEG